MTEHDDTDESLMRRATHAVLAGATEGQIPSHTDAMPMHTKALAAVESDDQPIRLYGVPGAEILYTDLATCYETDIEPWLDDEHPRSCTIDEHDVYPSDHHVASADRILEWLIEWSAENGQVDEGWSERWERLAADKECVMAAENLRLVMAGKMDYHMARNVLREIVVTWDDDRRPMADGEHIYKIPVANR